MKKATIFLAVATLLCGLALAGAEKIELTNVAPPLYEEDIHANANGFMVINETPEGATDIVIQVQLRDAAPEYEYVIKSGGVVRGTFMTNKVGNGGGHVNLTPDDAPLGATAVNICAADVGNTKLLRAYF